MCLLVIAWQVHPRERLIIAANRDEYHERPAAPLGNWQTVSGEVATEILAGRDLRAGGTWLAVDRERRAGVVTNFRDLQPPQPHSPSRGHLIPEYLSQRGTPGEFLARLEPRAASYSGFNLLLADAEQLWYASNRAEPFARALPPGVYGLSNHLLDTPWPKLTRVRRAFEALLRLPTTPPTDDLLAVLADRSPAEDHEDLPASGLTPEWERVLSAPFVQHPQYGTRSSTVLLLGAAGELYVRERRFDAAGALTGETDIALAAGEWC